MDQLCEPIEINRKYLKVVKEIIEPHYEKHVEELFKILKQDIDKRYLKKKNKNNI
jgi:hypothetical protein